MSQENQQGQVTDLEDSLFTEESVIDDVFNPAPATETDVPEAPAGASGTSVSVAGAGLKTSSITLSSVNRESSKSVT